MNGIVLFVSERESRNKSVLRVIVCVCVCVCVCGRAPLEKGTEQTEAGNGGAGRSWPSAKRSVLPTGQCCVPVFFTAIAAGGAAGDLQTPPSTERHPAADGLVCSLTVWSA